MLQSVPTHGWAGLSLLQELTQVTAISGLDEHENEGYVWSRLGFWPQGYALGLLILFSTNRNNIHKHFLHLFNAFHELQTPCTPSFILWPGHWIPAQGILCLGAHFPCWHQLVVSSHQMAEDYTQVAGKVQRH